MDLNSNFYNTTPTYSCVLPKVQSMNFEIEYQKFKTRQMDFTNLPILPETENPSSSDESKEQKKVSKLVKKSLFADNSLNLRSDFKLTLEKLPETQLYKGKYFSFKVALEQLSDLIFPASESLEIEMLVYNEENLLILKNMRGQDILKGNYLQNMHFYKPENKHVAYFKVQVTEVSSHFVGKSLKFQIKSRNSEFLLATGWKVKPIWIENIVVKAKKSSS